MELNRSVDYLHSKVNKNVTMSGINQKNLAASTGLIICDNLATSCTIYPEQPSLFIAQNYLAFIT